jgi:glycolate oxidase FAD binding subunit
MSVGAALTGGCEVRPGTGADAVAGVVPSRVAHPRSVDEVVAVVTAAAAHGLAVVARGAGTKLAWGSPPAACDLVVDLRRLDRVVDHAAGDMVVQVEAGVPLRRLASVVAQAGQQLALDLPAYDGGAALAAGTVGGAVAVGWSGPRRLRYGRLRDLLLGVTIVRADGVVASAGGRVVKNVAGYDLGKLVTGSYGTLGLVVAATLRLHPLPAAATWAAVTVPDPQTGYARAAAVLDSQLAPTAVEVDRPGAGEPVTVAALLEGTPDGVPPRAEAAAGLLGGAVLAGAPAWAGCWPGTPQGTLVELTVPPARLVQALDTVDDAARATGLAAPVRGSAGVAELRVGLPAGSAPASVAGFVSALRAGLATCDGSVVVRHAPPPVRAVVDVWGPVDPGALTLMRRVKDQFDPGHRLAPGRFVGGI